jgi:hypothetical protein
VKFVWIIAIIAAIGGGVYWWQRGGAAPNAGGDAAVGEVAGGGGVAVALDAGAIALDAAMAAERASPPIPGPAAAVEPAAPVADAVTFEQEVRDPAWAVDQEHELRVRLDGVVADLTRRKASVTIAAAECRARTCRIEVGAAGQRDLSAFYGALETPEGLLGWADGIVLGDVETDAKTGALTTRITVAFERDL